MKRKDVDQVNDEFSDFSLSSPALKIRRLDAELAPIIEEEYAVNPAVFEQSVPFQDAFVEQSMESSPIVIEELSSSVPENEERAIVLFNPMNNQPSLQSRSPFSISVDSGFLSGFKNPVIWSNRSNVPKSLCETQKQDDNSGPSNGCLAVVPWVASHSCHPPPPELVVPGAQPPEMMDADAMDVEDNYNTQQMPRNEFGVTSASEDLNKWQQHCIIPQPPDLSMPVAWLGRDA